MNKFKVKEVSDDFFETIAPTKLTESRKINFQTLGWGFLTDFYLESVKINKLKEGGMSSIATLRIGDKSGQVTCIVRGPTVGLLFGLTAEEWIDVEKLNNWSDQIYYRYFKNGLNNNFRYEQKLFYYFCLTNQKKDVLIAIYKRCHNLRSVNRNDAAIEIFELRKCKNNLLNLYTEKLKTLQI